MTNEAEKAYAFRPYVQDDVNFIQSSWASSYYKGANYHKLLSPDAFHSFHRPIRERILAHSQTAIIVCAAKDPKELILGWICVEEPPEKKGLILHYIYVKHAFKSERIATELAKRALPKRPVLFTHLTEKASHTLNKNPQRYKQWFHTPHLV